MLVMVKYLDGNYDMVVSHHLDGLIKSGRILEFRRDDGWARVGRDPIRTAAHDFRGEDRRRRVLTGQVMY